MDCRGCNITGLYQEKSLKTGFCFECRSKGKQKPNNSVFLMVCVDGKAGPMKKHESAESARLEADRLARLQPGTKVYVLQALDRAVALATVVRDTLTAPST
jgi:hypothetical protein